MTIEIDKQAQTVVFRTGENAEHRYSSGDIIGESYKLIDLIGQGGMGVVYRVQHLILDRQFALKLLAPAQINNLSWRRFELEGRSLAKLNHANIVSIYNMGVDRGCPYFVMDWLDGVSLAERIDESGPLTERESLEIFLQVCSGLSCAHANGIIHRDIKPANIMLIGKGQDTKVKIVDFGIARLQSQNANSMQALTKNGEVFGSPLYMSPEQSRGEEIDERSDLYSVGCSLFETLTGKPPFRGASAIATLMMHQEAAPPGLSSVSSANIFNPSLDVLMARCLSKYAEKRYKSADQMAIDLQRILDSKPIGGSAATMQTKGTVARQETKEGNGDPISSQEITTQKPTFRFSKVTLATTLSITIAIACLIGFATHSQVSEITKPATSSAKHVQEQKSNRNDLAVFSQLKPMLANVNKLSDLTDPATIKALTDSPNFSSKVRKIDGREMRCFKFPTLAVIGEIKGDKTELVEVKGEVKIPANENIYLRLNHYLNKCPSLLDKFQPNDVFTLHLDSLDDVGEATRRLGRWSKLQVLNLDGGEIKDSDLTSLDKIENLKSLWLKRLSFNSKPFSRLNTLSRLHELRLEKCANIDETIQDLPPMPTLNTLILVNYGDDWISENGIRALAKHKNLRTLKLKSARPPYIDDASSSTQDSDFERNYKQLPLCDWTNALKQLPSLERLETTPPSNTNEEIEEFLRQIPAARQNEWAAKFGYPPNQSDK
jgi:serine/threonine protein kinase